MGVQAQPGCVGPTGGSSAGDRDRVGAEGAGYSGLRHLIDAVGIAALGLGRRSLGEGAPGRR